MQKYSFLVKVPCIFFQIYPEIHSELNYPVGLVVPDVISPSIWPDLQFNLKMLSHSSVHCSHFHCFSQAIMTWPLMVTSLRKYPANSPQNRCIWMALPIPQVLTIKYFLLGNLEMVIALLPRKVSNTELKCSFCLSFLRSCWLRGHTSAFVQNLISHFAQSNDFQIQNRKLC